MHALSKHINLKHMSKQLNTENFVIYHLVKWLNLSLAKIIKYHQHLTSYALKSQINKNTNNLYELTFHNKLRFIILSSHQIYRIIKLNNIIFKCIIQTQQMKENKSSKNQDIYHYKSIFIKSTQNAYNINDIPSMMIKALFFFLLKLI